MCVVTWFPFHTTYYLNGHDFIKIELQRRGVAYRKDDNAFLCTADPRALQTGRWPERTPDRKRLNYSSCLFGPKFSAKDRQVVNLTRSYSLNQIEYCRNFIFKGNFPIHKIFERFCELGLFGLAADAVAKIFGVRVTKRLRGKLYSLLKRLDHSHHVLRVYSKSLVAPMYEKFSTFLSLEVCVTGSATSVNKGLENL